MDDFDRRRELRRQKREEMRLEAERLAYQRNDDDDEEAARERRRRARQERLRQREEDDISGTEKPEVNAQNNITDEESKSSTTTITTITNTQGDGDGDEAVFLERMAKREERRQKRLQEAMERQKEFDPTVTDESLSFTSRREVNNVEENEAPGKEDKVETHRGRYEIEETETITRLYQRNNLRQDEEDEKKEDKGEAEEEKPKQRIIDENQVEVTIEKKSLDKEEAAVVLDLKLPEVNADEQKVANDTSAVAVTEQEIESEEAVSVMGALDGKKEDEDEAEKERLQEKERLEREEIEKAKAEEERRAEEEREQRAAEERERLEQEERERLKAEEEERKRLEAEEKRAVEEKERLEAEERERLKAEEQRKAEEERKRVEAEEKRAAEEKKRREAEEKERLKAEEKKAAEERERAKQKEKREAEAKRAAEEKAKLEEEKLKAKQKAEEKRVEDKQGKGKKGEEKKIEEKQVKEKKVQEEKTPLASLRKQIKDNKVNKDKGPKDEVKPSWDRKKGIPESKPQNGERFPELPAHKLKHTENAFSRPGLKATSNAEEAKPNVEAGKRVEELRRRRGENENEEFEKMKQKQQEAAVELEELKKKREERRKILEEEEQRKKKDEVDRKAREEEEKRRLKEEIERRRAEAAEKRQKMPEEGLSEDKKPFKCFTPKGSSLKIEERAEFLNKSAQKSGMKTSQAAAVVSKIDSRLEQYTSAIEGTKASRPAKAAPSDLPVPAEGVRNIKSMWEKGNVFASPSGTGTPNKETAGLKVGVSSRINEWLTKTPENNKSPAPKPSDLRPGDVSGKRNLWEKQSVEKASSPTKVTAAGKKSEANGLRQFEKEP